MSTGGTLTTKYLAKMRTAAGNLSKDFFTKDVAASNIERYSRQLILKGWSLQTQTELLTLHVALPLSLPTAALYLAALGVGKISFLGANHTESCFIEYLKLFRHDLEISFFRLDEPLRLSPGSQSRPQCFIVNHEDREAACSLDPLVVLTIDEIKAGSIVRLIDSHRRERSRDVISHTPDSILPKHLIVGTVIAMVVFRWWKNK